MQQQLRSPSTPSSPVDVHEFLSKILFSSDVTDGDSYRTSKSTAGLDSDHELHFAILEEAWWDYKSNIAREKSSQRRIFDEVFDWFFNEHKQTWECSFEHLCELFDIEPNYIRKGIILWTKQYHLKPPPSPEVTVPKIISKVYPKYVSISEII